MKKKMLWLMFCLTVFLAIRAQGSDWEWIKKVRHVPAKVHLLPNGETWVIVPDDNANMRYISQQLPDEYKKNGLAIRFNGWIGKIPPYIRMLGTPLKLTKVWVPCREMKTYSLKKRKYSFQ